MAIIKIDNYISTELNPVFNTISSIEIQDGNSKGGAFGEVYKCLKINNAQVNPVQVIKIIKQATEKNMDTIVALQKKLKQENKNLIQKKTSLFDAYPALIAVPQFSFKGYLNGEEVYGYSANDLDELDYIEYGDILNDDDEYDSFFYNYSFIKKFKIAEELIKAMNLLWNMRYIHADIKDSAIFINLKKSTCALIDFDSGAIFNNNSNDSEPTTIGEMQDWLAPEIFAQFNKKDMSSILVNVFSDTWSINIAIFNFLFGRDPYFFIQKQSPKQMEMYLNTYKWPNIDTNNNYIDHNDIDDINQFLDYYNQYLPEQVKSAFETTFNNGYNKPVLRFSYYQWENVFKSLRTPLEIIVFKANKNHLTKKENVVFTWQANGFSQLFLNGTNVSNQNTLSLFPYKSDNYTLTAINDFGEKVSQSLNISVSLDPPIIKSFTANHLIREDLHPIKLTWNVVNAEKIRLQPHNIDVSNLNEYDVYPITDTVYTLEAESYFGIKQKQTLQIEISKKPPKIAEFVATPIIRQSKNPIELRWKTEKAKEVTLYPKGKKLPLSGSKKVKPLSDTTYRLEVISHFGVKHAEEIHIQVSKVPPIIKSFTANHLIREDLNPIKLIWNVDNAEKIKLQPHNIDVSDLNEYDVYPTTDTVYTLETESYFGVVQIQTLQIQVSKKPPVISGLIATPSIRQNKNPIVLRWKTAKAKDVVLYPTGEKLPLIGSKEVMPLSDTTYKIEAISHFGVKHTEEIQVLVSKAPPIIKSFTANRLIRESLNPIKLVWDIENAEKIRLQPDNIDVSNLNEYDVYPTTDTVYTLETESYFGVVQIQTLQIQVSKKPPIISGLIATPAIRQNKNPTILRWKTENAKQIVLYPTGEKLPLIGTKEVKPLSDTIYRLEAISHFGIKHVEEIEVLVSKDPPIIHTLNVSGIRDDKDEPIQIYWETIHAENVELLNVKNNLSNKGSLDIFPTRDTTYILKVTSLFGISVTKKISAYVSKKKPIIHSFSVNNTIIKQGESIQLNWNIEGAYKLWINDIEISNHIGSKSFKIDSRKTFLLSTETYFGVKNVKKITVYVIKKPKLIKYPFPLRTYPYSLKTKTNKL